MAPKSHIAVLQGGWSPEREVSLISGQKCAEALQRVVIRSRKLMLIVIWLRA